jgi:LPS export ABC transporter permease LptG/LPS export ABC transporter permease LptF
MRRLDRYIFREILTPAVLALVALTFIVFSRKVGFLIEIMVRQSPTASEIWAVAAALLPAVLAVTMPMSVLVGILTGFSRMSSDSEAIALRASGISMWRIFRPVFVFAILAFAVTMTLTVWVAPSALSNVRSLQSQLLTRHPSIDLRSRVFLEKAKPYLLYVNSEPVRLERGLETRGILLVNTEHPDKPEVTLAESGTIAPADDNKSIQLRLFNSSKHKVVLTGAGSYEIASVPGEQILSVPLPDSPPSTSIPVEEVSTRELWDRLQQDNVPLSDVAAFHQRISLPFACLAFALMALPLGVSTSRGGRSMGLVLSLLLMFAYYLALAGGSRATSVGSFSPVLGAWLPNIVFTIIGLVLLARADKQHQNRVLAFLARTMEQFSGALSSFKGQGHSVTHWAYTMSFRFRLFRLLDAYVLRGFWFFFTIVLSVFSALFIVVTLFELLPYIIKNDIPFSTVAIYFVFFLPQIFYWVIPLAVLLAILINLGTLTKSNEILAVKAGAISLYRMSLPLVLMAALLSVAVYVMQDYVLPWTNKRQDEYHDSIRRKAPQTYSDPSRKWIMGSDNRLYNYSFHDQETNNFANISILTIDPSTFQLREWFHAKRGTWTGDAWSFEDGWVREISDDQLKQKAQQPFAQKVVAGLDPPSYFRKEVREADQMSYRDLEIYVADLERSGLDVSGLTVALYRKLSFPLVSFIMALIGIPFSFKTGRKGAFYGIGFCLAVGILYWLTFELFGKLGGINQLPPFVAAWFPNFIFGASGFWLMLRVKT